MLDFLKEILKKIEGKLFDFIEKILKEIEEKFSILF